MRFQHIIWDWNGTLLDDTQAGVNAINAMLAARGLRQIDIPAYRELFGFPVIDFYRAIGFDLEQENWDAMAREFHDLFLADASIRLHCGATGALAHVRQAGIGQSILSASEQSILATMLDAFGVTQYFSGIFGVDNLYGHSKLELGPSSQRRPGRSRSKGRTSHSGSCRHMLSLRIPRRAVKIMIRHNSVLNFINIITDL
jgi:phosphoglycolate phosphatase